MAVDGLQYQMEVRKRAELLSHAKKMLFGVLNVHKPEGMTSRDVVNRVVRCCPRKTKVGHAGTLDPLATGVLVVAIGPATRLIQYSQEATKSYEGHFRLGITSNTEDITGEVQEIDGAPEISKQALEEALPRFHGIIEQTPPQFSAVKVDGKRAYQVARDGGSVEIQSRPARIDSIRLLNFAAPDFSLAIECGKGTYVRTLGRDIAKSLGSDAVMTNLKRTAVGPFKIASALRLDDLSADLIESAMLDPVSMIGSLEKVVLGEEEVDHLRYGKRLSSEQWNIDAATVEVAGVCSDGKLTAILVRKSATEFGPQVNFAPLLYP